tara:strand:+ start:877 stop:1296 length:420 start_codon:yes stop_codon:yes gene_type:complete
MKLKFLKIMSNQPLKSSVLENKSMTYKSIVSIFTLTFIVILGVGCSTNIIPSFSKTIIEPAESVQLPYIKNSPDECYFLDEFMPIPDRMVTGKTGRMKIRYYTYKSAIYKEYDKQQIILAFYSQDNECWSLFEEHFVQF